VGPKFDAPLLPLPMTLPRECAKLLRWQEETMAVPNKAREFLDLFAFASVHEDQPYQPAQRSKALDELVRRCAEMANSEGISRQQMEAEVGDLDEYFRRVIDQKNVEERQRLAEDAIADRRASNIT
jgi:hypothetical protein